MPILLDGEAIAPWFEFMSKARESYSTAKEKIKEQMDPASIVLLADFHKRTLQHEESLSVFAVEVK